MSETQLRLRSRANEEMTADQQAAIALFESLGFKAGALLRDNVRDGIVVLGHNVAGPGRDGSLRASHGRTALIHTNPTC